MTIEVPGHLFYPAHRVAVSGYYHDSLEAILTRWSFQDLVDAHIHCDALDEARAQAAEKGRRP